MSPMRRVLAAMAAASAVATTAMATTFVPMPVEDLTSSSVATVIGRVDATRSTASPNGHLYTLVDLSVEEVLAGEVPASVITLKEPGGSMGEIAEIYDGVPTYGVGEQVVVFLAVWPDGSLRTNHLALGRWVVDRGASGELRARQTFGRGVTLIPPPGRPLPATIVSLAELRAAVDRGRVAPSLVPPGPAAVATPPEGQAGDGVGGGGDVAPYVLLSPPTRFHEPDEGITINFLIDNRGDSIVGLPASRQAVVDALAEWTSVAPATITMANPAGNDGLTDDLYLGCSPIAAVNPHRVVFDDPDGNIAPPANCNGVLALGGPTCITSLEQKVFSSTTFRRALKGTVQFADGWDGCPEWTECNFAEVATHEIGHVLGLQHTPDNDATMRSSAHFDGRCADVRTDDINGVNFIYPDPTGLVTITTPTPLTPPAQTFAPYTETLTATGGTGSYTWSADTASGSCDECGLTLASNGIFSGTPGCAGTCSLYAIATDGGGQSHKKRLTLEMTASGTTTTTSTTTTTVTTSTTTTTTLPVWSIDHFLLYTVKTTFGQPKFDARGPVNLADQFRDVDYNVVKPKSLGLPADKNGEGVLDAATHLEEYQLRAPITTTKFTAVPNVLVSNQCSSFWVEVKSPYSLLVPTNKSLVSTPPAPGATAVDHYLCYKAKVQTKKPDGSPQSKWPKGVQVDLLDQFQPDLPALSPRRYDVKTISKVCTPVDKSGNPIYLAGANEGSPAPLTPATIQHPIEHLVCYKVMLAKKFIAQTSCRATTPGDLGTAIDPAQPKHVPVGLYLANQLGTERLDSKKEAELCIPSLKTLPP